MAGKNKFSPEQEQLICSHYERKLSLREIAEIFNCDHQTVRNILARNGTTIRPIGVTLSRSRK